jgi:PPE-repeat protein
MDFAALPPEINSGRMYAGPGSGSMLTAAAAWDGLASELYATAANYGSVISGLTSGPWLGVSSTAMASAAAPYSAWLNATAAQAEQTGAQAKAAAAAHATAFAMTVPPPVIAANRAQLLALIASNIFGQNFPAIAANEAHYAEMWAQDATAMHGYAAASQTASQVTPFTQPQQTTNPGGLAAQNAAASQVAGTSAGHASAGHAMSALSQALQGLTSSTPAQGTAVPPGLSTAGTFGDAIAPGIDVLFDSAIIGAIFGGFAPEYGIAGATLPSPFGLAAATPAALGAAGPIGLAEAPAALGLAGSSVSAGVGEATSLSGLSVPQAWATAAPEMRLAAAELPITNVVAGAGAGGTFGGCRYSAGRR